MTMMRWKDAVVAHFKSLPQFTDETESSSDGAQLGKELMYRDSNGVPPEYKSKGLQLHQSTA
jgi:hypothetical protein